MWLSAQMAARRGGDETPRSGAVSLPEQAPGVVTDGEQRQLQLLAPGGYCWRPAVGDGVLVIKDAAGDPCAAGIAAASPVALQPGEVCLHAGGASIYLDRYGRIYLSGEVYVNGKPYGGDKLGE